GGGRAGRGGRRCGGTSVPWGASICGGRARGQWYDPAMTTADLEEAVLHLPLEERAHLAQRLLESLDQPSGEEVQQMWLQEARRRAEEIDQGKGQLVSAEELEQRVQSLFK